MILRVGVSGISATISSRSGHFILLTPLSCQPGFQRLEVETGVRLEHGKAAGALAQHRVGHAGDRALRHRGVTVDHRFDVGRIEFDAAAVDHVFQPAGDDDVAAGVGAREIAGAEPAVGGEGVGGRGFVFEIAVEHRAAARLQFALFAGRGPFVFGYDAQFGTGGGAAGRG